MPTRPEAPPLNAPDETSPAADPMDRGQRTTRAFRDVHPLRRGAERLAVAEECRPTHDDRRRRRARTMRTGPRETQRDQEQLHETQRSNRLVSPLPSHE